jgi:hypothetical protein
MTKSDTDIKKRLDIINEKVQLTKDNSVVQFLLNEKLTLEWVLDKE